MGKKEEGEEIIAERNREGKEGSVLERRTREEE